MSFRFCVITKVPDPEKDTGNLASVPFYWDVDQPPPISEEQKKAIRLLVLLHGRQEVFSLGEILILDSSGREISGRGRKPDKWFVETAEFDTIDEAIIKARDVQMEREK